MFQIELRVEEKLRTDVWPNLRIDIKLKQYKNDHSQVQQLPGALAISEALEPNDITPLAGVWPVGGAQWMTERIFTHCPAG